MQSHPPVTPPQLDFERIFKAVPGLFLILSPSFEVLDGSDAYMAATMILREDVRGRHMFDVFPDNPDDPAATGVRNLRASLERVRESHVADVMPVQKYDIRQPQRRGGKFEERWWSPVNAPVLSETGELLYIIHRVEDVSDYVRLKEHKADQSRLNAELRARIERMESDIHVRALELHKANRMKDDFLAMLSHELRTPLTAMLGWVRLLNSGRLDAQRMSQGLQIIERSVLTQARLIDDLLDISRIVSGKLVLRMRSTDVSAAVKSAIDAVRLMAREKAIQLQTEIEPDILTAADPTRVHQMVMNLLTNAIKFTPNGGLIRVSIARRADEAVIAVRDNGIGIKAEALPRVFERFRQGDQATTHLYGGLGLGLAIVRYLAEQHGGQIIAESAGENRGSTFTLRLPIRSIPAVAQAPSSLETRITRSWKDLPDLSGVRVLLVEDDADACITIRLVLEQQHAYVGCVLSVNDALRTLSSQPAFNILLADICMPGEDGFSLIEKIRASTQATIKNIPAIALTKLATELDRKRILDAGFQSYLAKPVEPGDLIDVIHTLASQD